MKQLLISVLFLSFFIKGQTQVSTDTACIIQLNDVYEIGPLEGGRKGGMPRVASVIADARKKYPTLAVLAGDFLSPSVMGTAKLNGERVNGAQMVDLMNTVGIDMVTFGNHEFDIPYAALQKRINESQFLWISSNVQYKDSLNKLSPFYKNLRGLQVPFVQHIVWSPLSNLRIGFFALTIDANQQHFVQYESSDAAVSREIAALTDQQVNCILGLTHLSYKADSTLLRQLPAIRDILGGHEHQHMYVPVEDRFVAKADANAKTIYKHLIYKDGNGNLQIQSTLIALDSSITADTAAIAQVKKWEDRIYNSYIKNGINPTHQLAVVTTPLNGLESAIRYHQTNLGTLITESMLLSQPHADAAILNSGSIRIDDMVQGPINEMDIVRILPFGGVVCDVQMKGSLLLKILQSNNDRLDLGGFLQMSKNLFYQDNNWQINKKTIHPEKTYTIRTLEFLTTGAEKGLEYFKEGNPDIINITKYYTADNLLSDIRRVVIDALQHLNISDL